MIVRAHMVAYANGAIREIEVPDNEVDRPRNGPWTDELELKLLDRVFYYGQNDFQRRGLPSLSVGDVVELPSGKFVRCLPCGWAHVTQQEVGMFLGPEAMRRAYDLQRAQA